MTWHGLAFAALFFVSGAVLSVLGGRLLAERFYHEIEL